MDLWKEHFAVFLARMFDVGRTNFFTVKLSRYLEAIEKTKDWQPVMRNRRTLPKLP